MIDRDRRVDRKTVLKGALAGMGSFALAGALPGVAGAHGPGRRPFPPPGRGDCDRLRGLGITFDTGFFSGGVSTHDDIDPRIVRREMRVIHDDLHCTWVRITGGDLDRIEMAARHAADAGLDVWFSPFPTELTRAQMLDYLADAAERAERIRRRGTDVVLVTGAELALFMQGFLPGDTYYDRIEVLTRPGPGHGEMMARLPGQLNAFFAQVVPVVRARFGGRLSYAALPFETIDWRPFDYVGLDFYPDKVGGEYVGAAAAIRGLLAHGKPVVLTEIGCPSYDGAATRAGRGHEIVEWDGRSVIPIRLTGDYVRDEAEQADYLIGLLDLLEDGGAHGAFVCVFASYHLPHREGVRADLDIASYGIVRVLEGRNGETYPRLPWEPKAAFGAVADWYGARRGRGRHGHGPRPGHA